MKINLDIIMDIALFITAVSGIASILFAMYDHRMISLIMSIITMIAGLVFFRTALEISKRL